MNNVTPEQAKELLDNYFAWVERLGVTAAIATLGFLIIGGLLIYVIRKLVEGYVDQINDLRKQRDQLQGLLAVKVSSAKQLENLGGKDG